MEDVYSSVKIRMHVSLREMPGSYKPYPDMVKQYCWKEYEVKFLTMNL